MKRLLVLLVGVILLAIGASYLLLKPAPLRSSQLLPADTVLLVAAPDLRRSMERWPKTAVAQIGAEPAVADFLAKPLELAASKGGLEGLDFLLRLKPGRMFAAVTAVHESGADVVVGFEYFGGRADLDAAMERMYHEMDKAVPNAKRTTADYHGDAVTTFSGAAPLLFSGSHGRWGFLSNREEALHQALDRAAGRDKSPTLASNPDFKTVRGHLPDDPDFTWFARFKPVIDLVLAAGEKQHAGGVNERQLAQLEKMKAMGGTLRFEGEKQKEATFILYPNGPKLPPVDRSPMALTTPETTFYYDATLDWKMLASDDYLASLPPEAQAFLTDAKIDLRELPEIFGNDLGLIMSWPAGAMIPSVLTVVEVKDRKRVQSLVDGLLGRFGVATTTSELHGAHVVGFPAGRIQFVDPTLAIGDKFVYASITRSEIERALGVQPGTPTLEGAAAFKPALAAYKTDGQVFGYLDSKGLFEGIYNRVRPIAIFAAAMSADIGKYVDVNKLPETETISRHLSPIVYATRQLPDGWLVESSGPVTLSQVFFGAGIGGTAAYVSQMMKQAHP
jgi:hypothetical protein